MKNSKNKKHDGEYDIVGYFTVFSIAVGSIVTHKEGTAVWPFVLNFVLIILLMSIKMGNKTQLHKILYLSVFTLLTSSFYFMGGTAGIYQILFFVISAQAMMLLPMLGGILWVLLLAGISGLIFISDVGVESGLLTSLIYSGGYLFFGIFGRASLKAQEARDQSDALLAELQETHEKLQQHVWKVAQLAVAEERNRMAREIHDSLGHRLTVSSVQLEGAQRLVTDDPKRAEDLIATVRGQVKEALRELRQSVATLREPLETSMDFQQVLKNLIHDFESATDITVNLLIPKEFPTLLDTHRLMFFRSTQEALTNVQRHANAKQIWIQLDSSAKHVKLSFEDDGLGIETGASKQGFGIRGMRERAAQLDGECFIDSRPGGGTRIIISLPLELIQNAKE
jgi:signal transduction histidine kinase